MRKFIFYCMKRRQRSIRWNKKALLSCFVFVLQVFAARGAKEYLYIDKEDAVNVYEYIKPEDWNGQESIPDSFLSSTGTDNEPNFLSSPDYGNRVIVFYSPWCGHCINFAPKYMDIANETKKEDPDIDFYAVSCAPHRDICKKFSVRKYPTVLMIRENSVTTHEVPSKDLREKKTPIIKLFRKSEADLKDDHFASGILASLGMNLKLAVFDKLRTSLDESEKKIFKDWLNLLSNSLPKKWQASKMTFELLENFDTLSNNKLEMMKVVSKYSEDRPYCYLCGLWKLLHVITVRTAEQSKNLPYTERQSLAKDTASTIWSFMENFFDSSQHVEIFNQMKGPCWNEWCTRFDAITTDDVGKDWQNLAVWMWDVHNHVNLELKKKAEQNEGFDSQNVKNIDESKGYWPPREACKECWYENGDYNSYNIYDHLGKTYGAKRNLEDEAFSVEKLNSAKDHKVIIVYFIGFLLIALRRFWKGAFSSRLPSNFFGRGIHDD